MLNRKAIEVACIFLFSALKVYSETFENNNFKNHILKINYKFYFNNLEELKSLKIDSATDYDIAKSYYATFMFFTAVTKHKFNCINNYNFNIRLIEVAKLKGDLAYLKRWEKNIDHAETDLIFQRLDKLFFEVIGINIVYNPPRGFD